MKALASISSRAIINNDNNYNEVIKSYYSDKQKQNFQKTVMYFLMLKFVKFYISQIKTIIFSDKERDEYSLLHVLEITQF